MGLFSKRIQKDGITLLNEGLEAHQQNDPVKAINLLEESLKKLSSNNENQIFQAYLFLGVNYKRVNKLNDSYNMYKKASALAKGDENICEVYNAFGKICYLLNKQDEAVYNYMVSLKAALLYTTSSEHFGVIGGNLYHHLGHALADFDPELHPEFKAQIPEYKKSIMGQPNRYNQGLIKSYVDLAIGFWKKNQ